MSLDPFRCPLPPPGAPLSLPPPAFSFFRGCTDANVAGCPGALLAPGSSSVVPFPLSSSILGSETTLPSA